MRDYRNRFTSPTPPRLRLGVGEAAYRVISDDDDLDMSAYFSDADPDEDWAKFDGVKEIDEDNGYDSEDIYICPMMNCQCRTVQTWLI